MARGRGRAGGTSLDRSDPMGVAAAVGPDAWRDDRLGALGVRASATNRRVRVFRHRSTRQGSEPGDRIGHASSAGGPYRSGSSRSESILGGLWSTESRSPAVLRAGRARCATPTEIRQPCPHGRPPLADPRRRLRRRRRGDRSLVHDRLARTRPSQRPAAAPGHGRRRSATTPKKDARTRTKCQRICYIDKCHTDM
jgi:hypothetical protein